MTDGRREGAEDLDDLEALDGFDTLSGDPGEDPLGTGVIAPDTWSPAMRFGSTSDEQAEGESLDRLAEEEPHASLALDDEPPPRVASDENATQEEVSRYVGVDGPDPRAGRFVADDEIAYDNEAHLAARDDFIARDAGIDGAGASAEEAAVHVMDSYDDNAGGNA